MKPNKIGILGENLVAQCLQAQGWKILHQRWRCRWGELDIIAQQPIEADANNRDIPTIGSSTRSMPCLVFVEVKTRSQGNWDADGLLAIAAPKQAKLLHAAQLFLAERSDLAELPCRFDVAVVSCQRITKKLDQGHDFAKRICLQHTGVNTHRANLDTGEQVCCSPPFQACHNRECQKPSFIPLGQAAEIAGYQLVLQNYIQAAFDSFESEF